MRRNTKTMYEWRKAYRDKEELMLERGFPEVSPHEFYRDLFPEGSLQSAEHDGKGNLTPQKWGVIFNYIFPKTLLIRLAVKRSKGSILYNISK